MYKQIIPKLRHRRCIRTVLNGFFYLTWGTTNNERSADLSPLDAVYGCVNSDRYNSADHLMIND